MTKEEAISEWTFRSNHIKKWLDEYGEEPSIRHYVDLIDMAIESLSAEPSGDLISRADVIDAVMKHKMPFSIQQEVAREIDALPSADRQTEYNLETIADIVRQLRHLDDYVADICDRPKGEWIQTEGDSRYMCSVCKVHQDYVPTCMGEPTIWNYCPSCGADMKGGQDE